MPPFAAPRCLSRVVEGTLGTLKAVPLLGTVLGELRDAVRHIERLAAFAATELPEIVYQLEKIREHLAAIERKTDAGAENGAENTAVSPDGRRTG
ncbi:hypothetical protein [Amycolatopsis pigmentata]|uniref:Uncharacterized protein n=1 Tax=Amycolatopsis pigmentata TaxID=450801 RepID=A0ABW5FSA7_9PSEU